MESGSPGSRIDQFFPSKKRKPNAPASKSGRVEKDGTAASQGSPIAKGTLDTFLVTSQDVGSPARALCTGCDPSLGQNSVKRNLGLEINKPSEDEIQPILSSHAGVQSQTVEKIGVSQAEASDLPPKGTNTAFRNLVKDASVSEIAAENTEIKQFATDFLSIYCSELQSSVKLPSEPKVKDKRPASPLQDDYERTFKRSCAVTISSQIGGKNSCSHKEHSGDMQSGLKNGESYPTSFTEIPFNDSTQLQASLKRCNKMSISSVDMIECHTPASLTSKELLHGTPASARRSSMFSPGEAFWSEAIQFADNLCVPSNNLSIHVAQDGGKTTFVGMQNVDTSVNSGNGNSNVKLETTLTRDGLKSQYIKVVASFGSLGKPAKDLNKKISLPVKHFDFSCDEKNFDGATNSHSQADDQKDTKGRGNLDCGSVTKRQPTTCALTRKGKAHTSEDVTKVPKVTSTHPLIKRNMAANQDVGNSMSSPPDEEVKNIVGSSRFNEASTSSSFLSPKDRLDLTSWLPPQICRIYKKRGISKLYPWQVDCLQVDGVLEKRNLVYCASTSAGKSFVAEILMLRRVISTGKMALLVLPYVSICTEKAEHLEVLLEPLGKRVLSYFGNQGGATLPKDTSVAVCTIEKANSLINRLLEESRLSELGIIVIDELHMVGDQNRGYLLELLLTKLRYAAGEGDPDLTSGGSCGSSSGKGDPAYGLQIVGMSATMPNVGAVADWLNAALYETDFRPVPLEEYIKVGNTIYNKKMDIVRMIPKAADLGGKDPDHIVELCNEVVQEGHSVLIFCSSRKGCESTARHVSKFLKSFSANVGNDISEFTDVSSAIDALRKSPAGLDPILEETLPAGVAYHHAGLTVEEREIVETCYRKGLVRVLTATSTLAAGVNLPARRVIFRQPRIGRDFIDGTRYKQMAGRAGRTGIDTKGESVLICKPEEIKRIVGLLNESCPALHSCLSEDKNGMTHAILEVVAGGIVQTASDIHRYVRCTLLNSTKPFQDVVKSAQDSLRWLCHRKFLEWSDDTKLYSTTPLGRAAFGSSLCPEESLIVLDDLLRAREGFVLASDLHLVYLVTPINVDVEPEWELYYERFMQLSPLEQSVGNRVGVVEPFLMRMAHGAPIRTLNRSRDIMKGLHAKAGNLLGIINNNVSSNENAIRVCKRFYVALILSRLVQEAPVTEVCETFKVARGMVQALQENAGRFASMVSVFCERLGWHDLEGLVAKFQNRVSFGVRAEIVELTTIPYIKGSRARALYRAGLRTPQAIAEASIPEIAKAIFESSSWNEQEGTAQRRIQQGVAKKIKNGARKIILEKAEEARVAAFSAFKSLGLNVPPFSKPLLSPASANSSKQGGTTSSSGGDYTSNIIGLQETEHLSTKQSIDLSQDSAEVHGRADGDKVPKSSNVGLGALTEVSSAVERPYNPNSTNHLAPVEDVTLGNDLHAITDARNVDADPSKMEGNLATGTLIRARNLDCEQNRSGSLCVENESTGSESGPVCAVTIPGGIDSFFDLWDAVCEFVFDIHYNKRAEINSVVPFEMHGIAICWDNSPVYYVNIPKDLLWSEKRRNNHSSSSISATSSSEPPSDNWLEIVKRRWKRFRDIMGKKGVRKFTWNLKVQIQVLKKAVVSIQRFGWPKLAGKTIGVEVIDGLYLQLSSVHVKEAVDMCIAAWILWPDEGRNSYPNLEKEVKRRLPVEAAAAANQCGRWRNQMRRAAHNGCCRRAAQIRALYAVIWKLLIAEKFVEAFLNFEMPLVDILADMELVGIGIDMERCLQARNLLKQKLRDLEKEAYRLVGMTFSLSTAADIANVLYGHLKLPIPEGRNRGKLHPSTDKHCLDLLRHEHPIISIIKEHRTLAKLLNCTLGSICSLARLSLTTQKYTVHGRWLQTSTATGRLSMEEPNLQCVEHTIDFKLSHDEKAGDDDTDQFTINARDFFVPTQENWLMLTADYSQIELRLMAHFSKDPSLIELLRKPHGDVFTMIAARWTGKSEDSISTNERDEVKRLVYGILYGMGPNTLAEQLDCSPDDASKRIKSFKHSFPGVSSWLKEAVACCTEKGYVETLNGRKRFLSKIKVGNSKERSKAQRQAVNSICQGSAADIIKIAMLNIYSVVAEGVDWVHCSSSCAAKFPMLKGRCHILLQVHDELVLEVDPSVVKDAALLLQLSMENAASLLVPLHVKLKVGRTWGSLEPFQNAHLSDKILMACS